MQFHMLKTAAVKTNEFTVTFVYERSGDARVVTLRASEEAAKSPLETNLLSLALDHRIDIATACGGNGTCGLCNIEVRSGEEGLSPAEGDELAMFNQARRGLKILRLACQSHPDGSQDIEILIPTDPYKNI